MKKAFITGITGQDGSYLAELLLAKGYTVHGLYRRSSTFNHWRLIDCIKDDRLKLHSGDMTDGSRLAELIHGIQPDEVYNLAGQSQVGIAFHNPVYTLDSIGMGTTALLQAVRDHVPHARFYQASSSEMYGRVLETPQTERTPFNPRSPYGAAKACAFHMAKVYREAYGLFACNGILFNHESPRRGEEFVTRKIAMGVARIAAGSGEKIRLGNLDARRDWGFAYDYVEAMWLMLQQDKPDDYVVATGETHTVREFLEECLEAAGLNSRTPGRYVDIDPELVRPAEVDLLLGDASKAGQKLGWKPTIGFRDLAWMMVKAEMKELKCASRA